MRLGLPFVPSYLGQSGSVEAMVHGVNYASAASGIIFSSGSELVGFLLLCSNFLMFRNNLHSNKLFCKFCY